MPVPFGVGVGDVIAAGKLIGKIILELQDVEQPPVRVSPKNNLVTDTF